MAAKGFLHDTAGKDDWIFAELLRDDPDDDDYTVDIADLPAPTRHDLGGEGSGNFGHAGRPGEIGGSGPGAGSVPPEPGTTPIPEGKIRGYHYTDEMDAVEQEGLSVAKARGSTYGEPNTIWFSTQRPNTMKDFVEVFLDPTEIGINGPSLVVKRNGEWRNATTTEERQEAIDEYNAGNHDFTTVIAAVPPERFVTTNRPWHAHYRYLIKDPDQRAAVAAGEYDWGLDDPEYAPAIRAIKADAKKSLSYREKLMLLGGAGSGNFGHGGRPGEVGGSSSDGGVSEREKLRTAEIAAYEAFTKAKHEHARLIPDVDDAAFEKALETPEYKASQAKAQAAKDAWEAAQKAVQAFETEHRAAMARANTKLIEEDADEVAKRLNFDATRIDVVNIDPRPFEVGDKQLHEGGHFDPKTGRIEVNARTMEGDLNTTRGLIAHEIMHAQDHAMFEASRLEHEDIRATQDRGTRIVGGPGEVIKERESGEYERLFDAAGFPRTERIAEIEARWPASAARAKYHPDGDPYLGTWAQETRGRWIFDEDEYHERAKRMEEEDGFTSYSKLYWTHYQEMVEKKAPYTSIAKHRAIQETLAEVGAYQEQAPRGRWHEGSVPSRSWQAYGEAVHALYPTLAPEKPS